MLTALVLDIIVVLIIVSTVLSGYKKGFVKYVIGTLSTLVVVVAAFLATNIVTPIIYESYVQPKVLNYLSERVDTVNVADIVSKEIEKSGINAKLSEKQLNNLLKSDNDISNEISKAVKEQGISNAQTEKLEKKLDSFFENSFIVNLGNVFEKLNISQINKNLDYNKNMAFDTVRAMAKGDNSLAAKYLEQNLMRGIVQSWLKVIIFIVLIFVFSLLIRLALKATSILNHLPLANGVNRFFGILIGLTKGILIIGIVSIVFHLLIDSSGDSLTKINTEIIDKSYVFKHIYDFIGDWQ